LTDPKKREKINQIMEIQEGIAMASTVLNTISKDWEERCRLESELKYQLETQSKQVYIKRMEEELKRKAEEVKREAEEARHLNEEAERKTVEAERKIEAARRQAAEELQKVIAGKDAEIAQLRAELGRR